MSELHPCPECRRHIRKTETTCPFCGESVSLAHLPSHSVPRNRLGRAATFAFGASVVGATALVACGDDGGGAVAVYGAPPAAGAGGSLNDAGAGTAIYGGPPAGESAGGNATGGTAGGGGAPSVAGAGGAEEATGGDGGAGTAIYGGPPAGAGGVQ